MKKRLYFLNVKKIAQPTLAFIAAFILVNLILLFYERPVGWIDTPNGASLAVRSPNTILVHGTEGYGTVRIDKNGYTNSGAELGEEYVLILGSSHSQGKEIPSEKKYSEIVNSRLSDSSGKRAAYNIACDGFYLDEIIRHFKAAVSVFPDASCIAIEIFSTDFSADALREAMNQPEEVDFRSAEALFAGLSKTQKLKNFLKETFPLLSIIKSNLEISESQGGSSASPMKPEEYAAAIREALSLIRSEYSGRLVFIYHPETRVRDDGSLELIYSENTDLFRASCRDTSIDFIDVGGRFLETYENSRELPYGFQNTAIGEGHLNTTGHAIMAEAILDYLNGAIQK